MLESCHDASPRKHLNEQAERQLVSRIIGRRMYFAPDEPRRIEDMLIDRETGEVVHYVVETDRNAIFRADRRTVPAEQVTIGIRARSPQP